MKTEMKDPSNRTPEQVRMVIARKVQDPVKPQHHWDGMNDNRYFECNHCGCTQGWGEYVRNNKIHPAGPCAGTRLNYPEDLNAVREAEEFVILRWHPDAWMHYWELLRSATGSALDAVHADAETRARCLALTFDTYPAP